MFWDKFYKLCKDKGTKPNPVADELGYSNAVCTTWKNGTLPKAEALIKISIYFDVSLEYLLEDEIANEKQQQLQQLLSQALQPEQEPEKSSGKTKVENTKEEKSDKTVKVKKVKKVARSVKIPEVEDVAIFGIEFASVPPTNQPEPIIEEINGRKRIINLKSTDTIWLQSAAYDGNFPSFDKKASYRQYLVKDIEKLMNEEDLKL